MSDNKCSLCKNDPSEFSCFFCSIGIFNIDFQLSYSKFWKLENGLAYSIQSVAGLLDSLMSGNFCILLVQRILVVISLESLTVPRLRLSLTYCKVVIRRWGRRMRRNWWRHCSFVDSFVWRWSRFEHWNIFVLRWIVQGCRLGLVEGNIFGCDDVMIPVVIPVTESYATCRMCARRVRPFWKTGIQTGKANFWRPLGSIFHLHIVVNWAICQIFLKLFGAQYYGK
jgi:hypothetical protein